MQYDSFDEELEAEVARVLDPGAERRRQVAIQELHDGRGLSSAIRVVALSIGLAVILVSLLWTVLSLAL